MKNDGALLKNDEIILRVVMLLVFSGLIFSVVGLVGSHWLRNQVERTTPPASEVRP